MRSIVLSLPVKSIQTAHCICTSQTDLDTKYKVQTRSIFTWAELIAKWGEMVSGANWLIRYQLAPYLSGASWGELVYKRGELVSGASWHWGELVTRAKCRNDSVANWLQIWHKNILTLHSASVYWIIMALCKSFLDYFTLHLTRETLRRRRILSRSVKTSRPTPYTFALRQFPVIISS